MSQFTAEYRAFFESPAGIQCLTTIKGLIDSNHQLAENNIGDESAYMQRAKGNREVLTFIESMLVEQRVNPYSKAKSEQHKLH